MPINKAPSNLIVKIIRSGSDKLIGLNLMSSSIARVPISTFCGLVLV
ncbi:hypothetical protein [Vulcanisaeta distributa]|nr:hypothetical protein [Vulcanisaeta distributa]